MHLWHVKKYWMCASCRNSVFAPFCHVKCLCMHDNNFLSIFPSYAFVECFGRYFCINRMTYM